MSTERRGSRRAALGACASLLLLAPFVARSTWATADAWQDFTLQTWREWLASPAPAVVVFTSTDCVHCPAVISRLRGELQRMPLPRPLLRLVVTDGTRLTPALRAQAHYAAADLRAAWRGEDLPLHHAVNPRWHGETPYVVLLGTKDGTPRYALGAPSRELLEAWRR